jgi:hypothetical protein
VVEEEDDESDAVSVSVSLLALVSSALLVPLDELE